MSKSANKINNSYKHHSSFTYKYFYNLKEEEKKSSKLKDKGVKSKLS